MIKRHLRTIVSQHPLAACTVGAGLAALYRLTPAGSSRACFLSHFYTLREAVSRLGDSAISLVRAEDGPQSENPSA